MRQLTSVVILYFGYMSASYALLENGDSGDEEIITLEKDNEDESNLEDVGDDDDESNLEDVEDKRLTRRKLLLSLASSPGPITVAKEFGHVLFSSEGAAL